MLKTHVATWLAMAGLAGCVIEHPAPATPTVSRAETQDRRADTRRAPNPVVAGGTYAIRNVQDNEVITGPKVVSDKFVGVDDDRSRTSQLWTLLPLGGRKYQLQVIDTLACLADHGQGVIEETCDPSQQDQAWLIVEYGGAYEVMFRDATHCLAVAGRGKLVDADCTGAPHQLWEFLPRQRRGS
jgi:hypothetical protein